MTSGSIQPEYEPDVLGARDTTRLLRLLNRFSVGMTAVVDEAMGTDYASNPEILCVVALGRSKALTFEDLGAKSSLPRRSVSNLVRSLERSYIVTRRPAPHDRRVALVEVTPVGQKRFQMMSRELDEFFNDSQPIAKEIVHLLNRTSVDSRVGARRANGMALLESTASVGLAMVKAVEVRTGGRAVWKRQQVALLETYAERRLRAGALADRLELTSGGLTYLVSQLEARGLVERVLMADPDDRRAVEIEITDKGRRLAVEVIRGFEDVAPELARLFAMIRGTA